MSKLQMLANDFVNYRMSALCIQETHLPGRGVENIVSSTGEQLYLHYSGHATDSINGVGIILDTNKLAHFKPISDRICQIETKINNNQQLTLISAYAPTLEKSEKNPDVRDNFYNSLNSVVTAVKRRNFLIVAGDYNAKTGSAFKSELYSANLGKYGKGSLHQ